MIKMQISIMIKVLSQFPIPKPEPQVVELYILTPISMEYSYVLLAFCGSLCDSHRVRRGGQVADMKLWVVDTVE